MDQATADIRDHASKNLRYIREVMGRGGAFTVIPGRGIVLIGCTALAASWIATTQPTPQRWMGVWIVELFLAVCIDVVTTNRKARTAGVTLGPPFRRFLLSFAAPLFAGGILTILFHSLGLHSYLPSIWLLLYGTAIVTGGSFSVRVVSAMGVSFVVLSIASLIIGPKVGNIAMVTGFGGLHIVFGLIIARRFGG